MKTISFFIILFLTVNLFANDGAYFASGNQLIPINETDIIVKKEILTLKKVRNQFIEVTVYYEFFNPKEEKNIVVGFEAFSPSGDVDGATKNGEHPYMRNFTVEMNNNILTYDIAYVNDSLYTKNGKIQSIDLKNYEGNISGNAVDFYYVYYFNTHFKKGLNIIKHTYIYDVSGGICYDYTFDYILTAANRWGNNQIDDFTLIIDNGEFETFNIKKTFYKSKSNWIVNGIGKANDDTFYDDESVKFHIQKGNVIFQKVNFKPSGELYVYSLYCDETLEQANYIPFSYFSQNRIKEPTSDFEKKILRNLPFARRGYVFKNKELKKYYEQLDWYIPNSNYIPNVEMISDIEKKWIKKYS